MRLVLSMAISPNGLIAREDGKEDWLPAENWQDFLRDAERFDNFIMGRETYELVTKLYPDYNFDNVAVSHKVIVTRNKEFQAPSGYIVVEGPEDATRTLQEFGHEELLLIGGGKLNIAFLKLGLVDEIWLNITPYIIAKGRPFIAQGDFEAKLKLLEVNKLSLDRVMIKYSVIS